MVTTGGMRRKFTKDQMQKMMTGNLVSDRETQAFEDAAREAAQGALQTQQKLLNRAAAANQAGSPRATQGTDSQPRSDSDSAEPRRPRHGLGGWRGHGCSSLRAYVR